MNTRACDARIDSICSARVLAFSFGSRKKRGRCGRSASPKKTYLPLMSLNASEPTRLTSSHTSTTSRFSPCAREVPCVSRVARAATSAAQCAHLPNRPARARARRTARRRALSRPCPWRAATCVGARRRGGRRARPAVPPRIRCASSGRSRQPCTRRENGRSDRIGGARRLASHQCSAGKRGSGEAGKR